MKNIKSVNRLLSLLEIDTVFARKIADEKTNHYSPKNHEKVMLDGFVKIRRIDHPDKAIRQIQRQINKKLLSEECSSLTEEMTGGIKSRSTKKNAQPHLKASAILSVDITNCFPSITSSMIYNIYTKHLGYTPPVAKLLTRLTSFGDRLPQGSPASPSLCNLYFAPLVSELSVLCSSNSITFTQYIDDLTFSGELSDLENAQEKIIKLVNKHGLRVNPRKLALKQKSERLVVTGYVVNNSNLTVGRKYLNRIKRDIMRVDDEAQAMSISGKINYIGQVSRKKSLQLRKKLKTKVMIIKSSTDKK
jgi:RNA-directed DNA polymerase